MDAGFGIVFGKRVVFGQLTRMLDRIPSTSTSTHGRISAACSALVLAALAIPASLLWDFSWESTVGIDPVWSPPHVAVYLAIGFAAFAALAMFNRTEGVTLGRLRAPLGAWVVLWGALAFVTAFLFDRWWQAGYGLAAGIWHPPQMLKTAAFLAVTAGAALCAREGRIAFPTAGAAVIAMIAFVSLVGSYPNRQHSTPFFQIACATYPLVLVAFATVGRSGLSATLATVGYLLLAGAAVWLLPLVPATPQVAPIYNPRDHLMPPPFPLLLIAPALAIDALLRIYPARENRPQPWRQAIECGFAFFLIFLVVQWVFARFLLSPAADHWFFAGGGRHWPFFLKIDPPARVAFWESAADAMNFASGLIAAALAVLAARLGLWLGWWMKRLRR
jgi:hypothetical protein